MTTHIPSIAVVLDRLLQTPYQSSNKQKPNVLVIGAGWGSYAFLSHIDKTKYNVTVVSTSVSRLNQPRMIPDFQPSYKALPDIPVNDKCVSLETQNQSVLGIKSVYSYDYLVLATGSEPNDFGIKGVREHCFMFKTEHDLQKLKTHLKTNQPITVIGAGPTGIELAFKLQSLGHTVTILEAANIILPGFSDTMRLTTMNLLSERNITVKLNTKITAVDDTTITTQDGTKSRNPILIWTCGVKPTEFIRALTPTGRQLITDANLMFKQNIYAVGDIVANRGPPTAQNAKQQGIYLANHFNNEFKSAQAYKYNEKGRALDTSDSLIIEYSGYVVKLPSLFRIAFYYFTD